MSQGYGRLGRRNNSAAWQWLIMGGILGFACAATLVLGGLTVGFLNLSGQDAIAFGPTPTANVEIVVITATPAPVTPTAAPTEGIITPEDSTDDTAVDAPPAAEQPGDSPFDVAPPSPTPTTDPTELAAAAEVAEDESDTVAALDAADDVATITPIGGGRDITPLAPQAGAQTAGDDTGPNPVLLGIASQLVPVDGGTYQMGTTPAEAAAAVRQCTEVDEGQCTPAYAEDSYPQHPATVNAYQLELTEVTYEQFLTFMNTMGPNSHANGCGGQACMATRTESETSNITFDGATYSVPSVINNLPMVEVTWYGAQAYCAALGRRLPTEAEWERAARADDGRIYPWGDDWNPDFAKTNRSTDDSIGAVSVTSYDQGIGPYGNYNLAGNVAEWIADWYDERAYYSQAASQPDPQGPPLGDERVVRGGSWDAVPFFARTMHRQSRRPDDPAPWLGFRCAADVGTPDAAAAQTVSGDGNTVEINPLIAGTPDPSTLGVDVPSDANTGSTAPTLAPITVPTGTGAEATLEAGS